MRFTKFISSICVALLVAPNLVWARSDLDSRVTRLENIVENEYNSKLLQQIDALQQEISELRGKLEEQQNVTQHLNQKQEKLFFNLDARINSLTPEQESQQAAPPSTPAEAVQKPISEVKSIEPVGLETSAEVISGTSEKNLYEAANTLMRNKKYAEAILELKDLLWQFPEGIYAADAYYWLGELYRMQWHSNRSDLDLLNHSKDAFNVVIHKYQGFDREGDALLKLALLEMDQDHYAVAKDILLQVIQKFPNTSRARIAETNIARIDRAKIDN